MELIKPSEVYQLFIEEKWKFSNKKIKKYKTLPEKIWFIKKEIRQKTYFDDEKKLLSRYKLPQGLCIFKSIYTKKERVFLYKCFEKLFRDYKKYGIMHSDQIKARGLLYLFTGDKGKKQYYEESLEEIKNFDINLSELIIKIVEKIKEFYNIDSDVIKNNMQIGLLKYFDKNGIWMHIDNVARCDQGPIFTISIGPENSYVDLTPTLSYINNKNLKPLRLKIKEGSVFIMDGISRMEWAHGLPYNVPRRKNKYTLMFKFDKFKIATSKYNSILKTTITNTIVNCKNKNYSKKH